MGWPVAASQSRAVLSQLPVRTVLPSGLNATDMHRVRMRQGLADGLAGGGVPEPRRLVPAPGEDGLAVGAERHGPDRARMLQGLAEGLAGGGVPEPRRLVIAPGEDRLAVGAEGDRAHRVAVGEDLLELDVVAPPGRQVGQGDVPAGLVSRLGRHPQRLDGPEHPDADLPLLEGGLAALEIEHRQPAVRFGQRRS